MNINEWKQKGSIYLWRYVTNPKSYAGLHFTCDKEGCESLLELFSSLFNTDEDARRTINISAAKYEQLRVPGCKDKPSFPSKLVVTYSSKDAEAWNYSEDHEKVTLNIGSKYLGKLNNGILDIAQGKGDYSIGEKDKELWFWWHING